MLKRVGLLAALTLLATMSGLVREVVVAYALGTSRTADFMSVGVFLVDLANTLFLTGGVGFAFVPVIKRLRASHGDADAARLVTSLLVRVTLIALPLSLLIAVLLPAFTASTGVSASAPQAPAIVVLSAGVVAAGLMTIASSGGASLYGFERFGAAALSRIGWNLTLAASLVALAPLSAEARASVALLLASVGAVMITIVAFERARVRRGWSFRHAELGAVLAGAAPGVVSVLAGNLLLGAWERLLLGRIGVGSIAIVNYAWRASYVASALSLSVHTVAFNEILGALHSGGQRAARDVTERTVGRTLLLLVPLVATMFVGRRDIIALLYGRGAFGPDSVLATATVFGLYTLTVIPIFILGVLLRVLYALERPWHAATPTVALAIAAGVTDAVLVSRLGARAIPVGYCVGLVAGITTSVVLLGRLTSIRMGSVVARAIFMGGCLAVPAGFVAWFIHTAFAQLHPVGAPRLAAGLSGALWLTASLAVQGLAALLAAIVVAYIAGMPEVREVVDAIRRARRARAQAVS